MEYFLSHAGADKPVVRSLGVQLQVVGADVFFDEWNISAGESITGAIEQAITRFDVFLLAWSAAAEASAWTRREYQSGVKKFIEDANRSLIVVRLDDTPVPDLVSDLKWVDLRNGDIGAAADAILGLRGQAERIKAIQAFLDEQALEVRWFEGYGPAVGCLTCGASLESLEGWSATDYERDDQYAGVRCTKCGWEDGGEILF